MTRRGRCRRLGAVALLGVVLLGCGSDAAKEPVVTASPLIDGLLVELRASTDPAGVPAFDAAQTCLREMFAEYTDPELQILIDGLRTKDLTNTPDELLQRLRDDGLSCNEENRALDAADYQVDTEQQIADSGVTNVQCDLPTDISDGATFKCTGNFQNRTSEYLATISPVGHVEIERTD